MEFLSEIADQGVIINGKGDFRVGDVEVPKSEQQAIAIGWHGRTSRELIKMFGQEAVNHALNTPEKRVEMLKTLIAGLRQKDVNELNRQPHY